MLPRESPRGNVMRPVLLTVLTGFVLCQAAAAVAQQPTQAQANAIRQSCHSDYQAHCASVPTGESAALQCLRENMASLSPGCQSAVGATESRTATPPPAGAAPPAQSAAPMTPREQAMTMRRACGGDFRRYCSGVQPGGGRALACLADHRENLSPPCQDALASARGR
jgi:Cysteine rich repeat